MNLSQFPRRRYTEGETPLELLPRFTQALGGIRRYCPDPHIPINITCFYQVSLLD